MLDEPTEGVWIGVIEEIAERLKRARRARWRVILVEQHLELALASPSTPMCWIAEGSRCRARRAR